MPAVVTFDPLTLRIIEIGAGGFNELDIVEVYSEWKVWVTLGDNAKYPKAFRFIGGDPLSATQDAGITYFLTNGWRIRPAELSHKLTIVGNLFTDPAGFSAFVFTLGTFVVNTETRVSNLVDSSVSRLDLTQLLTEVYVDVVRGVAGTAAGVGTPTNPSNNVADARIIADRDNLRAYAFIGTLSLGSVPHMDWSFRGISASEHDVLNFSGADVTNSKFDNIELLGSITGPIEAVRCDLALVSGLDGIFHDCGLDSTVTIADGALVTFHECFSLIPGTATPGCILGANSRVGFRRYSGGIELRNVTNGCLVSVDLDPGHLKVNADCTGGVIVLRGLGRLTNNSSVVVIQSGFLAPTTLSEAHLSVAYDGATMELGAWLERRGSVIQVPTSAQVDWYDSTGTLIFTLTSNTPDVRGHFGLTQVQALVANEGYYAVIKVTDAEGVVENRVGVPTVGP